jgi:3-oxo-5-alpha-steroid 4-dehydrogenase 1
MGEVLFYRYLLISWTCLALIVFTVLFFFDAPYGRLSRGSFGPALPTSLGWLVMESPAALGFFILFILGTAPKNITAWSFLILWELHYLYRAFAYPFLLRGNGKRMPLLVVAFGFFFNIINIYLNGRYLFSFSGGYPAAWLIDPRFAGGAIIYLAGLLLNRQSDHILRSLRLPGETGYKIPQGGFFRWVSCPNYLGEIVQWFGWALATWSLAGFSFAIWTCANLVPRAYSYHRWYQEHFPEYPPDRAALIPHWGVKSAISWLRGVRSD